MSQTWIYCQILQPVKRKGGPVLSTVMRTPETRPDTDISSHNASDESATAVFFNAKINGYEEEAIIDTAAKSIWVDKNWFMEKGGAMTAMPCGGAESADGSPLDVEGTGILQSVEIWGSKFENIPVKVMTALPSKIIFGIVFWAQADLTLKLGERTASICVNGRRVSGPVWICKTRSESENVRIVDEEIEVVRELNEMDLYSF